MPEMTLEELRERFKEWKFRECPPLFPLCYFAISQGHSFYFNDPAVADRLLSADARVRELEKEVKAPRGGFDGASKEVARLMQQVTELEKDGRDRCAHKRSCDYLTRAEVERDGLRGQLASALADLESERQAVREWQDTCDGMVADLANLRKRSDALERVEEAVERLRPIHKVAGNNRFSMLDLQAQERYYNAVDDVLLALDPPAPGTPTTAERLKEANLLLATINDVCAEYDGDGAAIVGRIQRLTAPKSAPDGGKETR